MYVVFVIVCLSVYVSSETVRVSTSKGDVIGAKKDGYKTFFGVPYAKVDEDNPFGKSLAHPNFETPFIANDSSIICPQVIRLRGGILQCLRLNIYVPTRPNTNKLPTLAWFYGGGFVMGSAGQYDGQHLTQHDIIVVTINYRLGPYGFFCLDDENVPGNQGLKDQIAALRWIKENIEAFGGDSDKITIAGESYGGGAVDLHLYSIYETLFDKAIVQSGSVFTEGFYMKPDYKAAVKIANHFGHNVTKTKEALKVLSKEDPINVMEATKNLSIRLTVCKEKRYKGVNHFVTKDPFHLYKPDRVRNIPIMFGYNSKEDFGTYANKPNEFYDTLGDIFYSKLKKNFDFLERELRILSNITKRFYLGGKEIGPESMLELVHFSSDFMLNNAAERSVDRIVNQGGKVFKYLFSYIGGSEYRNITGAGAIHTEELKYLFGTTELKGDEQLMMRQRMTTMWAQFVKFGNPTPEPTDMLPVTWTPVDGTNRQYLDINVDMSMNNFVYHDRVAYWDLFWLNYVKHSIVYSK